jgi:pimeloyl-ACP methyl ester carboxylesterase
MRRRMMLALVAGGTAAGAAWARSAGVLPGPSSPVTGMFPNGMAYIRWGAGPKTLLWIVGGPGIGFPIGLRVALLPVVLRPFAQAGYTCWWVNRKRDMPPGYTIADMADDHAILIAEQLEGKVDLVFGEDYGGLIGLHLAARHPDRLGFLAAASAGYAFTEQGKALDRDFAALIREGRRREAWAPLITRMAPNGRLSRLTPVMGAILDRLFYDRSRPDFVSNLMVETEAEEAYDARGILPDIRVPVLLAGGDQGPFLSREILEETARLIPDCTLQIHEGQNDLEAVSSTQLARDILKWLEERTEPGTVDTRSNPARSL